MCIRDSLGVAQDKAVLHRVLAQPAEGSGILKALVQAGDVYKRQAGAQPGPDAGASNNQQKPNDDGVVDADFKEV